MKMPPYLAQKLPILATHWDQIQSQFTVQTMPAGHTLLAEGEVADAIYIIVSGALRLWHNAQGRDITLQFFFENQLVASFESFYLDQPSDFTIESLEPTQVLRLSKVNFDQLRQTYPALETTITRLICERFVTYRNTFFDQLQLTPTERYQQLVQDDPELIERVPLHLIAAYLGITPVSLSRIRTRLTND
ncbi:Crp/Fnr family transcriptional regulator [Lactiplantibacillus mudanjiangensis]|uniref:Crp/Fnr family transcriptional regulator [Lactobacillus allii] n=1 Tax=Lactiplantibacillus mudanjiangensis TaxID=1296538 RepID=A0A660DZK2_9LACO|nr:Crp/Fnr family transcriptional regulator [Lactiplantibacillus mudanjiangensis]VDG25326.1 Crp/Fnr family transcriptional regulator [Lactobacillus allii] [Lactiplantibacillus mudanjiangensis]VDG27645.1 Crp/Fnr family transcriptional regulator [Lactobacillus allii] [Lactiplantibacillus mudanjiangensis]VDG32993.1 Crp/Fnr family transcriptional regulator [Lactobacillus allii] [Lactiplantibacillus mudanjiangensis]